MFYNRLRTPEEIILVPLHGPFIRRADSIDEPLIPRPLVGRMHCC